MDEPKYSHPTAQALRRYADSMQAHARIPMPAEAKKAADEAVAQVLIIELAQCWDKAQGRLERAAIAAAARKYVHLAGVSRRQWDEMVKTGEAGNA